MEFKQSVQAEEPHDEACSEKNEREGSIISSEKFVSRSRPKRTGFSPGRTTDRIKSALSRAREMERTPRKPEETQPNLIRETATYETEPAKKKQAEQLNLFEEHLLKQEEKAQYKLMGRCFETYWLVEFQNSLYIIDQHAAHERVLYQRTLKEMKTREFTSRSVVPPII